MNQTHLLLAILLVSLTAKNSLGFDCHGPNCGIAYAQFLERQRLAFFSSPLRPEALRSPLNGEFSKSLEPVVAKSYRSSSDSPFPITSRGFFLENFEDGQLNSPGVTPGINNRGYPRALHITVAGQGESVDGDDGSIDGEGTFGRSVRSEGGVQSEDTFSSNISLMFDSNDLEGALPDYFGFVLTAAPLSIQNVTIELLGDSRQLYHATIDEPILSQNSGTDDVFYGVFVPESISQVSINIMQARAMSDKLPPAPFEIDHVQYGITIPEPSSLLLLIACGLAASFGRSARRPHCF